MMKTNEKEVYQDNVKDMLDAWSAEISRLRAQAMLLETEIKAEVLRRLAELEELYGEAFKQYVEMRLNADSRLEGLKRTFDRLAERVEDAIDDLSMKVA